MILHIRAHFCYFLFNLESSAQLKDEQTMADADDKSSTPEATSTNYTDKIKYQAPKEKTVRSIRGIEGTNPKKSKLGRYWSVDAKAVPDVKRAPQSTSNPCKRKRKSLGPKVSFQRFPLYLLFLENGQATSSVTRTIICSSCRKF